VEAHRKAMNAGSGTAGGYTVPADPTHEHPDPDMMKDAMHEQVCAVMARHVKDDDGHLVLVHPESGALMHSHPADADEQHLARIKEALLGVAGVQDVHQAPGWQILHPKFHRGAY